MIADLSTPVPGSQRGERFRSFHFVDISGDTVVFNARGDMNTEGIYFDLGDGSGLRKLVDTHDEAPGGTTSQLFLSLVDSTGPVIHDDDVLFFAEVADFREGLFVSTELEPPVVVVDKELGSGTTLPGGDERVDRITALSIYAGEIALVAQDEQRVESALYASIDGVLTRIVGSDGTLGDKQIKEIHGSSEMRSGQTLTFGTVFDDGIAAIYRADPGETEIDDSGMIDDGSFFNGLALWTTTGEVQLVAGPAVELTSDTDSTVGIADISQRIDTYNGTFMIWFDYRFSTIAGSLEVLINDAVVATIPAPANLAPTFQQARITVNDPVLMGLDNAILTLRLKPGSLANLLVASIYSPRFRKFNWFGFSNGIRASGDFDCANQSAGTAPYFPAVRGKADLGFQAVAGFRHANGADSIDSTASALTSPFGVQWGFRASATASQNQLCTRSGLARNLETYYVVTGSVAGPVPLVMDLIIDGKITFQGDFAQDSPGTEAQVRVYPHLYSERYRDDLRIRPATIVVGVDDRNVGDIELSGSLIKAVQENPDMILVTDKTSDSPSASLTVDVNEAMVSSETIYAPVGDLISVEIQEECSAFCFLDQRRNSEVAVTVDPEFNGTVDADFLNTFTADLTTTAFGVKLVPQNSIPDFQINVGHSGAWFNPATVGQGQVIEVEPESQFMFLSWFTFTENNSDNPDEQHWFTAQGNYSENTASLDLYETLGGKFDDPQMVTTSPVGEATVIFDQCGLGAMQYSFHDRELEGTFPLQRLIPDSDNLCKEQAASAIEAVDINAGMDGAWFNSETPGQGFFIDVHVDPQDGNFIFVSWFTFGDDTASGQRWFTAQGGFAGSVAAIDVFETTGGSFDDGQPVNTAEAGTLNIDFSDCRHAELTYLLEDEDAENSYAITRVIPESEALCEMLVQAR